MPCVTCSPVALTDMSMDGISTYQQKIAKNEHHLGSKPLLILVKGNPYLHANVQLCTKYLFLTHQLQQGKK